MSAKNIYRVALFSSNWNVMELALQYLCQLTLKQKIKAN